MIYQKNEKKNEQKKLFINVFNNSYKKEVKVSKNRMQIYCVKKGWSFHTESPEKRKSWKNRTPSIRSKHSFSGQSADKWSKSKQQENRGKSQGTGKQMPGKAPRK